MPSRLCAASATPASTSPPSSASPRPPSSRILKRRGLNLLCALEPAEPSRRYEREKPGEIIHIDIKKLGRFNQIGHRITGDRTRPEQRAAAWRLGVRPRLHRRSLPRRLAQILPDEKKDSAVAFLAPPSPTSKASASRSSVS